MEWLVEYRPHLFSDATFSADSFDMALSRPVQAGALFHYQLNVHHFDLYQWIIRFILPCINVLIPKGVMSVAEAASIGVQSSRFLQQEVSWMSMSESYSERSGGKIWGFGPICPVLLQLLL